MRVAITICVLAALLLLAGCHDGLHYGHGDGYYAHAGSHHVKKGGRPGHDLRHGYGYRRGHPHHGRHGHGRRR